MNTPVKMGLYAAGLLAVFGLAAGVGQVVGPVGSSAADEGDADAGHGHGGSQAEPEELGLPGGLQISQDGYTLEPLTAALTPGLPTDLRFAVTGPDGERLTEYTTTHDKDLHLIVVRRDLSGFQHVHPQLHPDGTWSVPLTVREAGEYRAFADFAPAGQEDSITLGMDVPAPGTSAPRPLPPPSHVAQVDGYTVELEGTLVPGRTSELTLTVSKDGRPVTDLQPYLAAYGHLVALRQGDLAYLHVHPDGEPGDGRTAAGPRITFFAEVPSAGQYRLYLDFRHGDVVRTAEFTAVAGGGDGHGTH